MCVNDSPGWVTGGHAALGGIKFAHWPRGADVDYGRTLALGVLAIFCNLL